MLRKMFITVLAVTLFSNLVGCDYASVGLLSGDLAKLLPARLAGNGDQVMDQTQDRLQLQDQLQDGTGDNCPGPNKNGQQNKNRFGWDNETGNGDLLRLQDGSCLLE